MLRLSIKKLLVGAVITTMLGVQILPLSALAATDDAAAAAAQAGVGYLAANQNNDGSINGYAGSTDWAVMAIAAGGQNPAALNNGSGTSAVDFIKVDTPAPTAPATDVERKIIAIAAAGQNSHDFGSLDYNTMLAGYHADQQIGDPGLLNDDIFGVIAASAAKDATLNAMAQDGLNYFLAHQALDGGFSYTTDTCAYCGSDGNDTAAAIIAMKAATSMGLLNANLSDAQAKALAYLLSTQQSDGGFGYDVYSPSDGSSTAWALMALNSVGDTVRTQALSARDWLLANQNADGGFSYGAFGITDSDTYTTAHAIMALLGTTWLLQPDPLHVAQQSTTTTGGLGGGSSQSGSATPAVVPEVPPVTVASSVSGSEVLGAQTTTQTPEPSKETTKKAAKNNTKKDSKASKPSFHYAKYAAIVLGLIAVAWYILQSRLK